MNRIHTQGSSGAKLDYSLPNITRVLLVHAGLLFAFKVGISWVAFATFMVTYYVKLFAVSGVFHRYYTHRSYEMGRGFCFLWSFIGCTAGQRGPLSWTTVHSKHHQHSDKKGDPHSPVQRGLFYAHLGWLLAKEPLPTSDALVRKYKDRPEILWLDRHYNVPFIALFALLYALGAWLESSFPALGTSPGQMMLWGGLASSILLLHSTCSLNSFAHVFGIRVRETPDNSRNLWWLYPFLVGENYHNNHHKFPRSANFGVDKRQYDLLFFVLLVFQKLGLVKNVRDASRTLREKDLLAPEPSLNR